MNISCTNIEQSRKLIEAGIDVSTADFYITPKVGGYVISTEKAANSVPSWSVVALYETIPTIITYDGSSYEFGSICKNGSNSCKYENSRGERIMYFGCWEDLVAMLFKAVLWFPMAKDDLTYERD